MKEADRRFGGILPRTKDGQSAWPPRTKMGWDLLTILKRVEAKLTGGELVWLRDHDEIQTIAVARRARDGILYSARYWPNFRPLQLNENGSVVCLDAGNGAYVRNWVASDEKRMIYMLMQNSDIYADPKADHTQQA